MKKEMQIKRKHHFVWSHYLKNWQQEKKVSYINSKGNTSSDSVKGLAREIDFYKISYMTDEEYKLIKLYLRPFIPFIREYVLDILDDIRSKLKLAKHLDSSNPEEQHSLTTIYEHNVLEDFHSQFEKNTIEILEYLSKGDISILNDSQNLITFYSFLGHQCARTKAFKEKSLNAIKSEPLQNYLSLNVDEDMVNSLITVLDKHWWFMSMVLGTSLGYNIFIADKPFFLIENKTALPFLTSDQPFTNMYAKSTSLKIPPKKLDLYFPISPNYAFMVNDTAKYDFFKSTLTIDDVHNFNFAVSSKAYSFLFSNSESSLSFYRKAFINRKAMPK
ncbi:hypothetical protein CWC28_16675 [Pseudoalteromonas sp. S4492]|uniref:DUF4238 domain-containing protein n=1 Tax=Pseudoalteromonas sp. S4492 TaxID=579560 RepID=UPI00110A42EF|nr:DUF4238 domain-containing protein [Pseudoalteromonas sp. S4492]TMO25067.1 hypothetical protein CWC28_16675 [Pseudoalteromonas sp. S4492]